MITGEAPVPALPEYPGARPRQPHARPVPLVSLLVGGEQRMILDMLSTTISAGAVVICLWLGHGCEQAARRAEAAAVRSEEAARRAVAAFEEIKKLMGDEA